MERIWLAEYEEGVPADIDLREYRSIVEVLESSFGRFARRPAFTSFGKQLTFAEIDSLSRRFAAALQARGFCKGDRLALMLPNVLQYPIALFGALRAGVVVVNVNPLYKRRELLHQLRDAEVRGIVIFANAAHHLAAIADQLALETVIVTEIGDMLDPPKRQLLNFAVKWIKRLVPPYRLPAAVGFRELLAQGDPAEFRPADLALHDLAFLQYTGGTTGIAKGAMLSHGNMVANMLQARAWIKHLLHEGQEIIVTALPLYHIFSLTANCFVFTEIGALNVLIANPRDMHSFVKELARWPFTAITGVNTLFNGLLHQPAFRRLDFRHLRLTLGGGMAVQRGVADQWQEVTGHPLIEAYGLTETSPAAVINPMNLKEFNGYIGVPIPSTEVEIRDDEGRPLPFGEVGEVCIRGPQVMQGYWRSPDETSQVMGPDGFFRSGDLGFMTEKGYVKLVDRKKDMILVSGFNVYPNEIEEVAALHPLVLECAVIGIPDEKSGEVPKLFVVPKGEGLTAKDLLRHCRENLTGYKVPREVEFRSELPKSPVGKVLRKDLR